VKNLHTLLFKYEYNSQKGYLPTLLSLHGMDQKEDKKEKLTVTILDLFSGIYTSSEPNTLSSKILNPAVCRDTT
jgi:hypothetical protein